MWAGGIEVYWKEIQAFNTFSAFNIFYLYNNILVHMVMAEFRQMMEGAIKLLEDEGMVNDQGGIMTLLPFTFWKSFPKLPGSDPGEYA